MQKSLTWIKKNLQPSVLLLSEPYERGDHDLWDTFLGLHGFNINLPVAVVDTRGPFKPVLTRYRFVESDGGEEALESDLIKSLSSNDTQKIDAALTELDDEITDPSRVIHIINQVFEKRGLYLDIDKTSGFVNILKKTTKQEQGYVSFIYFDPDTPMTIAFEEIYVEELKGKRLVPLIYRWMQAHPYFREELSVSEVYLWKANSNAARTWFRSGLEDIKVVWLDRHIYDERNRIYYPEEIRPGEEYECSARFRKWPKIESVSIEDNIPANNTLQGL
jgi:hypothetical protein